MCLAQQDPAIPSAPPHPSPLIHDCYTPFSFISLLASLRAQSIRTYISADQCSERNEATSDKLSKSFGCSGTFSGQLVSFSAKLHWVTSHKLNNWLQAQLCNMLTTFLMFLRVKITVFLVRTSLLNIHYNSKSGNTNNFCVFERNCHVYLLRMH